MSEGVETETDGEGALANKLCNALMDAAEAIGAKEDVDDVWMAMAVCSILKAYLTRLPMHDALHVCALHATLSASLFNRMHDDMAAVMEALNEDFDDADDAEPARYDA